MGNPVRAKISLVNFDYDSSEVYSDLVTGFYNRMVMPGIYKLKFQAPGYYDYTSDFFEINSYRTSLTVNAQLIPYIIPVELVSFNAFKQDNNIELKWTTATETNNLGFEIHRKIVNSNENNSGTWETIGFVKGKGTSTLKNDYSFIDKNLSKGSYLYRLKQIDFNGVFNFSNEVDVEISSPEEYSMEQNYPNPFNHQTRIKYSIKEKNYVSLKVYDVLGKQVANLVDEVKQAGEYEVLFNASSLSSGIYYYTIKVDNFTSTKKLALIK
jgi:hypothetical protein